MGGGRVRQVRKRRVMCKDEKEIERRLSDERGVMPGEEGERGEREEREGRSGWAKG